MTYNSPLASADQANGIFDLYEAERTAVGWETTRRLSPSGAEAVIPTAGGVSSDHRFAFSHVAPVFGDRIGGSLAGEDGADYLGKPDGSFELTGIGSLGEEPLAQGRYISPDGEAVIFSTGHSVDQSAWCFFRGDDCVVRQLEPQAAPTGTGAIYSRTSEGTTRVVSVLPGGMPPAEGEDAFYRGVSTDGSVVSFEIGGTLYAYLSDREDSVAVASGDPTYAGLSADGQFLFYISDGSGDKGTIHRFNTQTGEDIEANPSSVGQIVNISDDGSHVYFVSEAAIGGEGTIDQPNLFVWNEGAIRYVATVAPTDLERTSGHLEGLPALTNWTGWVANPPSNGAEQGPGNDSSRTTPDGAVLIFESRKRLTSYDNDGRSAIYRYDDGDGSMICVSCPSSSQPAVADSRLQELSLVSPAMVIENLSEDGNRVFFETAAPISAEDGNSVNDIYEWRKGASGGPVLISSGRSTEYLPLKDEVKGVPMPNVLLGLTPDGHDVTFMAQDALVPGAGLGGTEAIYDARVEGGFPGPSATHACLEEECKPSPAATGSSQPALRSETMRGSGSRRSHQKGHCRGSRAAHRGRKGRRCHRHRHNKTRSTHASTSAWTAGVSAASPPQAGEGDAQGVASASEPQLTSSSMTASSLVGNFADFDIESVTTSSSTYSAGQHPDFTASFVLKHGARAGTPYSDAHTEAVSVTLPPGLLGNPGAIDRCDTGQFVAFANCPVKSQVGIAKAVITNQSGELTEPVYNLNPPHPDREVARLGFYAALYPVFIDISVRTASDYGVTATVHGAPGLAGLLESKTILWGNPADPVHDELRLTAKEALTCSNACEEPNGKRSSGISQDQRKAFMTNPSACQEGSVDFAVTSYQLPGRTFTASTPLAPITDCTGLPFAPSFEAEPTSDEAGASTGLKTKLVLPQHLGAEERATSTMREARVTLPEGMQVAAGAANWIGTCSDSQVGYHEEVDTACPDNSKLGTATIISPALSVPIEGTIYQRAPEPGHQLGLWLTADALGLHIKLPGSLEPDKQTGRLTAVFSDLPQVPVQEIDLNVWGGARAPLQNPDHCGTFTTDFSFTPHSNDPAATGQSQMQITEGCNQGFSPTLHAGVTEPVAGKFSPFVFDLTRPDGQQALRGFELKLPDGELAKIKGVPLCSDDAASSASCPQGSRIGSIQASTGPGPDPLTIPQPGKPQPQIYLAGHYKSSPFSIVSEVPAQAGPFDLGVLAVRSGLDVEPATGQAVVKADPLPQFFEGVGIAYRNLHAVVDRPEFNLNPTDCREMAVTADVTSTQGAVAHPAARFQVDGCKALKFKPKLSLQLKGGTKRADYPALTAVLKARKGDANIASASVALPHSEFLAQEHIGTICTRVQFVADKCPKGSVYGKAKAITPLLDQPLSGPVYLRSSNHPLPDLVAKLGGQLEIDLVGRIDSVHGGIRTTFESVPDAPVSKFVLQMKGGKKSLLTNSTDICRGSHRATVQMKAQNGRAARLRPVLVAGGCSKKKLGKH
jgi:hypothetical protein